MFATMRGVLPSGKERNECTRYGFRGSPRIVFRKPRIAYDEAASGRFVGSNSVGRKRFCGDVLLQERFDHGVFKKGARGGIVLRTVFFGRGFALRVHLHEEMKP